MKITMVLLSAVIAMSASTSMAFVNMPKTRLQASADNLSFILGEGKVVEALAKKHSTTDIVSVKALGAMNKFTISTATCSVNAEVNVVEKKVLKQGGSTEKKWVQEVKVSKVTCNDSN